MAKKEANQAVRDYLAGIGREGGKAKVAKGTATLTPEERSERGKAAAAARAKSLTPAERSAIAKKAAEARWGKKRAAKKGAK